MILNFASESATLLRATKRSARGTRWGKGFGVGYSPLLIAVGANHRQMVQLRLENGANPDEHHRYNYEIPLQKSVWENYSEIANLLLDSGAEPGKSTAMADMEATGYNLFTGNNELVIRIYASGGRAGIYAYLKVNMLVNCWTTALMFQPRNQASRELARSLNRSVVEQRGVAT